MGSDQITSKNSTKNGGTEGKLTEDLVRGERKMKEENDLKFVFGSRDILWFVTTLIFLLFDYIHINVNAYLIINHWILEACCI